MPIATAPATAGAPTVATAAGRPPTKFVRATHRTTEPAFDVTQQMDGSSHKLGPFDIPASGFLRNVVLRVTSSGGDLTAGALSADYPFNVIESVEITDTNGYPLTGPISGYQLYLANLAGAYRGFSNPTDHPGYSATVNPAFFLRIPVEITPWDGFGALANQNASAPWRVRITLADTATAFSTAPTAAPLINIQGIVESYSQPPPVDLTGNPNEQAPPGHGTAQFWTVSTPLVAAAKHAIRMTRTGYNIRNLVLVHRTAAGVRSATVEPDTFSITWDTRQVHTSVPTDFWKAHTREIFGYDFPAGVLVFPFTDDQDGTAGYESRHLWLPTVGSTRFEYEGVFGAAGTVEFLVNDVALTELGR